MEQEVEQHQGVLGLNGDWLCSAGLIRKGLQAFAQHGGRTQQQSGSHGSVVSHLINQQGQPIQAFEFGMDQMFKNIWIFPFGAGGVVF